MTGMSIRDNVFSMGANGFSSANSYPRQVANPADAVFCMVEGPSIYVIAAASGSNGANIQWRFECGDLTFGSLSPPGAGFAIDRLLGV